MFYKVTANIEPRYLRETQGQLPAILWSHSTKNKNGSCVFLFKDTLIQTVGSLTPTQGQQHMPEQMLPNIHSLLALGTLGSTSVLPLGAILKTEMCGENGIKQTEKRTFVQNTIAETRQSISLFDLSWEHPSFQKLKFFCLFANRLCKSPLKHHKYPILVLQINFTEWTDSKIQNP